MENKHKFEKNPKYYTISLYVIATVIISAILLKIIWHWASTIKSLEHIIGMLMPFLIGLLIAYLMNPLVKGLDKKLFEKIFRIKKANVRKALSIFISYIFVLGIIIVCISVIIPEIYSSLKNISSGVQESYNKLIIFLEDFNKKYPDMDISYVTDVVKENSSNIIDFVKGSLDKILPMLYNTSVSVISWIINIIIAITSYSLFERR